LTISYTGDATIAGALGGTAQFSWFSTSLVVDTFFPLGKPIDIGPLSAVPGKNSFVISFRSLRRSDIMSAEFQLRWKGGPFDAFAFLTTPNQVVPGPLTLLQFFYPPGLPVYPPDPPSNFSGPIFAFDDAVQVGTWEVTLHDATPLPAALPLFATGLGSSGLLGWRRKKKSATALAA
jgi:hypothetical protein